MAFYDIVGIGGNKAASHIIIMCHMSGIWFFFSFNILSVASFNSLAVFFECAVRVGRGIGCMR